MRCMLLLLLFFTSQLYTNESPHALALAYGAPFGLQHNPFDLFALCRPDTCCTIKTKEFKVSDCPALIKRITPIPVVAGWLFGCLFTYNDMCTNQLLRPIACTICTNSILYVTADYCPKRAKCTIYHCSLNNSEETQSNAADLEQNEDQAPENIPEP